MKPYRIADYLTEEQKRRALASTYLSYARAAPRDPEGYCPLGRALAHPHLWPSSWAVAAALGAGSDSEQQRAAQRFIVDWDDGALPPDQLAAALGLAEATP